MRSAIRNITIDCRDPYELARFWAQVVDRPMHDDDHPGDPEAVVLLGEGLPKLLFQRVPEAKAAKNRLHLDLEPDHPRDDEVERLVGLGHLGGGPPPPGRHRVGHPGRPRGQRVLRRAQRRPAGGSRVVVPLVSGELGRCVHRRNPLTSPDLA